MGKCKCATCDCNVIHSENVQKAKRNLLDNDVLLTMADFYRAMSDSTRIKILSILCRQTMCVCDLSTILNMTKSAVSHQLQNLKEMSLIKSEKRGKEVWYSLADQHVEQVFKISLEHVLEELNEKNG